jgi:hypothetical protein
MAKPSKGGKLSMVSQSGPRVSPVHSLRSVLKFRDIHNEQLLKEERIQ